MQTVDAFKIDDSKPVIRRKRITAEFLLWSLPYIVFPLTAGVIGFGCVMYGDGAGWPGFNGRSGFWGTHHMDPFLYSLGNYHLALLIVAFVWFSYGAVAALLTVTVIEATARAFLGR